jgi:hypothetical protein
VVETPLYETSIDPAKVDDALAGFTDFHPIGGWGIE